mmetsp:Transcript_34025/g.55127  ORF Transcript_34025/g.55127 Transcript_34025/m.55127 type:complete len:98 (-) Transcript_34025:1089-1382(-)
MSTNNKTFFPTSFHSHMLEQGLRHQRWNSCTMDMNSNTDWVLALRAEPEHVGTVATWHHMIAGLQGDHLLPFMTPVTHANGDRLGREGLGGRRGFWC